MLDKFEMGEIYKKYKDLFTRNRILAIRKYSPRTADESRRLRSLLGWFIYYYMEYKKAQDDAASKVANVVLDVAREFEKISGRTYGLFETYRLDDAEIGLVILNSAAGTSKDIVDEFRDKGIKAGLFKPRLFRPFPYEQVGKALQHLRAICVLDRCCRALPTCS